MRKSIHIVTISIALVLLHIDVLAQVSHKAVLWQGFSHKWTYNHRCNRLGDYVQWNNGNPQHVHTSATGTGPDSTTYTSNFSLVEANDIWFTEGNIDLTLSGSERKLLIQNTTIVIPLIDELKAQNKFVVYLNGYDLSANTAADKIQFFRIQIKDDDAVIKNDTLYCPASVALVLNCQSLECPEFKTAYTYNLKMFWLLAAWKDDKAYFSDELVSNQYSWTEKEEIFPSRQVAHIKGRPEPSHANAAVGIRAFSITLSEALWLLQLSTIIHPSGAVAANGTAAVESELFYKEWSAEMRKSSIAPTDSRFAFKRKGWAVLDIEPMMVQFKTGSVNHRSISGTMFWTGKNAKPHTPEAMSIHTIK